MDIKDVPESIKARAAACKSSEELLELAKEEGYELSDGELESITGGWDHCSQEKYGCGMIGH